ncbi:glycosyltransferase [Candidatus Methylospira mobilis]|uniref:Glycosyltransferase n=1 Tax=Candidatus Methylospira mobilis TaxID=1808979 RepID=A0A5Q0BQR5_9GAMM|nr:MJ1255/VC2487 family glycosyltransferase [Candidatus Methylospira mobilis]QFY44651.1 glycosyltransferase [Candidatus Methylospira mobilis]WNV05812.1 glycosyltransferase family protein [Candidatus Methylospira mobilis]
MKIFYGVQGTGNGHITRARAMAPKLKAAGIDVTFLFTGRPWKHFFEMEAFGDFEWRDGLTFQTKNGSVQYIKTALTNPTFQFIRDVKELDLSGYDKVITDFEPVTAWAAKLRGIPTIGLGHQYAFGQDIPKAGANFIGTQVLKYFAPATIGLGIHWNHFHMPILPPLIETDAEMLPIQEGKIIVYLPFEDVNIVINLLKPFKKYQFYIYSPMAPHDGHEHHDHLHVRQLSRAGFQHDFANAAGVISNAGFELASESLHMGKKILAKPLHGQMEQQSNALALEVLQLGEVMQNLDAKVIETWLENSQPVRVRFPDVASAVVNWLLKDDGSQADNGWIDQLWQQTVKERL